MTLLPEFLKTLLIQAENRHLLEPIVLHGSMPCKHKTVTSGAEDDEDEDCLPVVQSKWNSLCLER